MRRHDIPDGSIVIEEQYSVEPTPAPRKSRRQQKEEAQRKASVISADKIIDTIQTYEQGMFSHVEDAGGGTECIICGKHTAYDNRHICVECFKAHHDEIMEGLRQALEDVEVEIQ